MADFQQTASAATPIQNPASEALTKEAFSNVLEQNITETWGREFAVLQQGRQFLSDGTTKEETKTFRTWRDMDGVIPQNRDADDLPVHNWGEGFSSSLSTYNYRDSISLELTLMEVDTEGVVRGKQEKLAKKAKRTTELIIADFFNRCGADGTMSTGAPNLSDDGMYMIDGTRPNPNPAGGTWSNIESSGAITEASLFQAQLNSRQQVDENGELYPTSIKKVIIRPDDALTMYRLNKSDLRVGTAQNDVNWAKGRFAIEEYDYMTSAQILYLLGDAKSMDNEARWYVRAPVNFKVFDNGNPDLINQRVRFAIGIWLGSPRKTWRGGPVA